MVSIVKNSFLKNKIMPSDNIDKNLLKMRITEINELFSF